MLTEKIPNSYWISHLKPCHAEHLPLEQIFLFALNIHEGFIIDMLDNCARFAEDQITFHVSLWTTKWTPFGFGEIIMIDPTGSSMLVILFYKMVPLMLFLSRIKFVFISYEIKKKEAIFNRKCNGGLVCLHMKRLDCCIIFFSSTGNYYPLPFKGYFYTSVAGPGCSKGERRGGWRRGEHGRWVRCFLRSR